MTTQMHMTNIGARLRREVDAIAAQRGWRARVRAERLELDGELSEVLLSTVERVARAVSVEREVRRLDVALRWDGRCVALALVVDGVVDEAARELEARRLAGWGATMEAVVDGGVTCLRIAVACRDEAACAQVAA